ncbi:MAG: hypothetical protein JSR39_04885 [Verrucomicrobia bacterium]|nr:hypothetical protein [Verrucomicrobiota bacterium]
MSAEVTLKRKEASFHSEESHSSKMQRTSIDHTPLFFTIHGQLEADEGRSSAKQIAEMLLLNPDILFPFQQSSIREIRRQFRDISREQELGEKAEKKLIDVANRLYETSLRNSPVSQILPVRNGEIDALQTTLSRDLKSEANTIKRESRLVLREIRSFDITALDLPAVQAYLSTLHQLSIRFVPILELKKCISKDENTRMHDLAAAYRREHSEHQFPRILSDYPAIVKQVEKLDPVFDSVSETINEIRDASVALHKRQAELVRPPERSPIEEEVLIPFGQVVYPVAAQCIWQIFRNSATQNDDPKLRSLFESGQLKSPIPEQLDYIYLNQLWSEYFTDPKFEDLGFEEWMKLVLMEIEPEKISSFCAQLQALSKAINEIVESKDITKPDKELLSAPCRAEMTGKTQALFEGCLNKNQRTLAEVSAFLLSKSLK